MYMSKKTIINVAIFETIGMGSRKRETENRRRKIKTN